MREEFAATLPTTVIRDDLLSQRCCRLMVKIAADGIGVLARLLGAVERDISPPQQFQRTRGLGPNANQADAGADSDGSPLDQEWSA